MDSMDGDEAPVRVMRSGHTVAIVTLNRAARHNALNQDGISALVAALESCVIDPDVRALVLTGAGVSFCSGDDLEALQSGSIDSFAEVIEGLQAISTRLFSCPKPIVAALNGPAYGAGLELVLACDMRVAVDDFVAATPEVRLGLVATNGATILLPHLIGPSRARDLLLGGERKDAAWCLAAGLVDELLAPSQLLPRAVELATKLAEGAPGAVAATRHMLNAPLAAAMQAALRLESETCVAARQTAECAEGVAAFFARRPPDWRRQ